jgi:hypothetical protein
VAEDEGAHRPGHETHPVDAEGLQGADHVIGSREIELGEHQAGDDAVEEEVVPLDDRADRSGEHGAVELASPVRLLERPIGEGGGGETLGAQARFLGAF